MEQRANTGPVDLHRHCLRTGPPGGYSLLSGVSPSWIAVVQTFAGGAILMMLANTMIPEAYEHGGKLAGVFTVMGFAVSVWIIVLEHSGTG